MRGSTTEVRHGRRIRFWPAAAVIPLLCGAWITAAVFIGDRMAPPVREAYAASRGLSVAPAFALTTPDGRPYALAEFLGEQPVLLEFMSPDCPHCLQMAPILTQLHATYGDRVRFVTIAYDKSAARIERFAKQAKHAWPYLLGTQAVAQAYKLDGVPTFFGLDAKGRVLIHIVGSTTHENMVTALEALLQRKP
jgi:thiol-disulfide isomerase/thioredoxin